MTFRFEPTGTKPLKNRPVVCGFGPSGMFAALLLAQYGYKPLVIERGSCIEKRQEDVNLFWKEGRLNYNDNVQFGEGGAGAFSDGKLTTRSKDPLGRKVLEELVANGAKKEILIDQHPHIGTDAFVKIIANIRNEIIRLGGEFRFDTCLTDLVLENEKLVAIEVNGEQKISCEALLLCMGHSADDTIEKLLEAGLEIESKPFAIGVRIEHDQKYINDAMLGEFAHDERLIPARYQLTYTASNGKGVYTFCMCPGGYVIPSSSSKEQLVVNGMSYASRSGENANSALLVQVDSSDYGNDVLSGLQFQKEIEKKAYDMGGSYKAPAQLAKDYLKGKASTGPGKVKPTYELGVTWTDLNPLFSKEVNQALHEALENFEKKVPGFVKEDAILTAVESRSSSPIRIPRDKENRMSNLAGVYPAGEGSGYAGGIMTSAIDGEHAAMALMMAFDRPSF